MKSIFRNSVIMLFIALLFSSCQNGSTKSPEGTIKLLFQYTKNGDMTKVKELISSGYLDNYDENRLRKLFIDSNTKDIELEVVENQNQRALVRIKLNTSAGILTGNEPVKLLFKDGGWKIDYSGMSWPRSLSIENYY